MQKMLNDAYNSVKNIFDRRGPGSGGIGMKPSKGCC